MLDRTVVLVAITAAGCTADPVSAADRHTAGEARGMWSLREFPKVDVLVVVDDSVSMAAEATTIPTLLLGIADPAHLDLRVGITTTTTSSPACTSTGDGELVATSCRERLAAFTTKGDVDGPAADVRDAACLDWCELDALALPHPWIEHSIERSNLPEGITFDDAIACMLPQGVAGCAFESPLDAMRRAIERAWDPTAAEYGFLREDASLVVVFATDEDDCSVATANAQLFDPAAPSPLWAGTEVPTSAACRRASGAGLLEDVEESVRLLNRVEDLAQRSNPDARVVIASVVGVPESAWGVTEVEVEAPTNDAEAEAFGVAASCVADERVAYPPSRVLALANAFEGSTNTSICVEHYGAAADLLAYPLPDIHRPLCVRACVADIDPSTPTLDPSCWLEHRDGERNERIRRCDDDPASVCWTPIVDEAVDASCDGAPLEIRLVGDAPWLGGSVHWTCEVADGCA